MGVTVNHSEKFIREIRSYAALEDRSIPKQIEHWAKIGRIAEENPELSYHVIRQILLGMEDVRTGNVEEYQEGSL